MGCTIHKSELTRNVEVNTFVYVAVDVGRVACNDSLLVQCQLVEHQLLKNNVACKSC